MKVFSASRMLRVRIRRREGEATRRSASRGEVTCIGVSVSVVAAALEHR